MDCLPSLTPTDPGTGSETHHATLITVTGTADAASTGDLRLIGQEIGFENGFTVASGGEMSVAIDCP